MLTAKIIDNELITTGQPVADEVYQGVCCEGFGWVACYTNAETESVMGHCQNPDCPMIEFKNDPYGAISHTGFEDLALYIAGDGRISDRTRPESTECHNCGTRFCKTDYPSWPNCPACGQLAPGVQP